MQKHNNFHIKVETIVINQASNNQWANKAPRIIIAGGGTGGHIFPAIAIANAIRHNCAAAQILFVGALGKMEMEKVPEAGYSIEGLPIAGFNRTSLVKNIRLPFLLLQSFFKVKQIFKKFKPQAVIGVGGYSSFPVLRYAQSQNIATFIHESNSFAGKSNMLLAKKATKVFVASDGMEQFFPKHKLVVTGNPVRKAIVEATVDKKQARDFFQLNHDAITVLVVGGSLGAQSINKAIGQQINVFQEQHLQLIWQTGKATSSQYIALASGHPNIWANEFISRMDMAYAAADIVVSRSGAMSVTELCVVQKPTIFVPYPHAAEDHQTVNALHLVNKQAALLVKDVDVEEQLVPTLVQLANNTLQQQQFSRNMAALAITNADERIAQIVLAHINQL
jgi:UDP-N-acetylglucosamine--N-acetylmuramyl-(pentapeptide) pyrophosphoryl-undecaprenol N-acetylglucosamine transferase